MSEKAVEHANRILEYALKAAKPVDIHDQIFEEQPAQKAEPKPEVDGFDSALNRAFNGEQIHITKKVEYKPTAKRALTFDEAVKKRLG